jgi:signal transduction histidine kinase
VNATDICLKDTVTLASNNRAKELPPSDVVNAVLARMETLDAEAHVFCARMPDLALAQHDASQDRRDTPVPLEVPMGLKEPAVVWSGFGISYIDAMIGALIQQGRSLPVLLNALCGLFDATVDGCFSSILLLDRTRTRVQHAVGPGLPQSYNELLEGRLVSGSEGPCRIAANQEIHVILSDVTSDARRDGKCCPAMALAHGLKSCWSSPILSLTGEMLGIFALYQHDAGGAACFHPAVVQQFTHIARAVIERAHSEEALKRSEALLAKGQHLSSTGTFCWRVTSGEIIWSREAYRIFEVDPAVPMTLELLCSRVHSDDLPLWYDTIARARRGCSDYEYEYRVVMPDHSTKYLHTVAQASFDQDGQLQYIGAVQDVTQRRLSEQALAKVRSELAHVARVTSLGALTASIAHEVNQPLCAIVASASTCLRMLAADPPDIAGARETARRTIHDGNRAANVIKRLRTLFSKKNAVNESVDLNEAAREVISLSLGELHKNRVIARQEFTDDLPCVIGDRVQLQQVILNLLLNAADAMSSVDDRPRELVIKTERDDEDYVRLSVRDTGLGIGSQDADKLFEAFYTTKKGGMGIGLSIAP